MFHVAFFFVFSLGSDLFNVTTASGQRQMIVIETNSCPSGQKSMPFLSETNKRNAQGGYRLVIESAFENQLSKADPRLGGLAVICDKNMMESSGYAAVLADVAKEKVWLCEWFMNDPDPDVKWNDGVLYIRDKENGKLLLSICCASASFTTFSLSIYSVASHSCLFSLPHSKAVESISNQDEDCCCEPNN